MEDLRSSEQVTRLLRRKGESAEYLLNVSERLLNGQINIYLPRKNLVLVDWLLDKLQTSGEWRLNDRAWLLLAETWKGLESEMAFRSYGNHRFGAILCDTFNDLIKSKATADKAQSLIDAVSNSVLIINRPIADPNLLQSLFSLATWLYQQELMAIILESEKFVSLTSKISKLAIDKSGVDLATYVNLLADQEIPEELVMLIKEVVLLSYNSLLQGAHFITRKDIENADQPLVIITYLFNILVDNLPSSNGPAVFDELTNAYPEASSTLLAEAVTKNIKVKDDTLKKLLSSDVSILKSLIKLDGNLVISEECPVKIFELKDVDQEMATLTISTYSGARKMERFLNFWPSFPTTSIWKTSDSIKHISAGLSNISPYQLRQLLDSFKQNEQVSAMLVDCLPKQGNLVLYLPILTKMVMLTDSWQLKYKILSLHRDIADSSFKDLTKSVKVDEISASDLPAFISCIFRLRELEGDFSLFHEVVEKVILNSGTKYLSDLASRWFVLIENCCSQEEIAKVAQYFVKDISGLDQLAVLSSNFLFFEQPTLVHYILHSLIEISDKQKCDDGLILSILSSFPIEVYSRSTRLSLIDSLTSNIKKNTYQRLQLINKVIERPMPQSVIESKSAQLWSLFKEAEGTDGESMGRAIIQKIARRKAMGHEEAAEEFLKDLRTESRKGLSSKKHQLGHLKMACLISEIDEGLASETVKHISKSKSPISVELVPYMAYIPAKYLEQLKGLVAELCVQDYATCFPVLCKLVSSSDDILALIAVYSQIDDFSCVLDEGLISVIESSSGDQFDSMLQQVIAAALSVGSEGLFRTIFCFVKALNKTQPSESVIRLQEFVAFATRRVEGIPSSNLLLIARLADYLLKDQTWVVNQFMLETYLVFVSKISLKLEEASIELFISCCQLMSSVLLFHRHRLNGRYHLVTQTLSTMLKWLGCKSAEKKAAHAYARLLANLCEPPVKAIRERGGLSNLTSSSGLAKRQLAKYLPNLLLGYISVCLNPGLPNDIKEEIKPGIYSMMDVLDPDGLKIASGLMDYSSRAYLRPLYKDYKQNGKWQAASS